MRERFAQIYARDEWGGGSGPGSSPTHAMGYVRFLQAFIGRNQVRSVVDLGCGDWQVSRLIDWQGVQYDGFDIVPEVIERDARAFGSDAVRFHLVDGPDPVLPPADLLIVKDVLQHWSNKSVLAFLPTIGRFKFALLTNCVDPRGETAPRDTEDGGFRYLDLRQPPFSLDAELVYAFTNARPSRFWRRQPEWRKHVLLVGGGSR